MCSNAILYTLFNIHVDDAHYEPVHEDAAHDVKMLREESMGGRLADLKQEVGVLEHVHPETQRQAVVLPRVDVSLIVSHAVALCLSL